MSEAFWIAVDDPTAVSTEVDPPIDARVAGNGGIGLGVLVAVIIDSCPGISVIVGAIDAPRSGDLGAAVERGVFVERRRFAETNRARRIYARHLDK
jgi:hypothetical protein